MVNRKNLPTGSSGNRHAPPELGRRNDSRPMRWGTSRRHIAFRALWQAAGTRESQESLYALLASACQSLIHKVA